ncbi:hypothetical protein [Dictyobacter arantiisoli]|uniref:Uncharacterized protein n=1 Tax=Dictyobacter arantiisoli TaxID=2014874 RepID=A0A5A5TI78_9CHLR|nr:hypothetical protein [Dictyobacter arantiisoli]GCF10898.1 hypothetical protein KDI_44620 [Dictyobacter arantiisoli]
MIIQYDAKECEGITQGDYTTYPASLLQKVLAFEQMGLETYTKALAWIKDPKGDCDEHVLEVRADWGIGWYEHRVAEAQKEVNKLTLELLTRQRDQLNESIAALTVILNSSK